MTFAVFRLQSWTKSWRQIHKIKQSIKNVLQLIFCNFLPKNVKIWLSGGRRGTWHQTQVFPEFSWVIRQRVRQLVHSLSGDNLIPFHLWRRQIVLKSEKVSKCFVQDWGFLTLCSLSFPDFSLSKHTNFSDFTFNSFTNFPRLFFYLLVKWDNKQITRIIPWTDTTEQKINSTSP